MAPERKKPQLASQRDSVVNAAIAGLYRFEAKSDALGVLEKIATDYLQSKEREATGEDGTPVLRLWIRGYELSADDKAKGYRGHFAKITLVFTPQGYYTLQAQKLDIPLERHPEKDRAKGHHPNWGNPLMRAVETGKVFSGMAEAAALLEQLHVEYPAATIPGKQSLSVLLYKRKDDGSSPIEKVSIRIKPLQEGGAKLVLQKRNPRTKNCRPKPAKAKPKANSPPW